MSTSKAAIYGVKKVVVDGPDDFISGPCIIWAIHSIVTGTIGVYDNIEGSGRLVALLFAAGSGVRTRTHYVYPQGLPCAIGVATNFSPIVITYTPLRGTVEESVVAATIGGAAGLAAKYGVVNVSGTGDAIVSGRAMLWGINHTGPGSEAVWDSLTDNAELTKRICAFQADIGTDGPADKYFFWPSGCPIDTGISASTTMRCTYTPLPE